MSPVPARKIAYCLEYPIAQAGGVSVLVRMLMRELAASSQIILVSPDTPEGLGDARLGHAIQQHIPWSPADASRATARALAEAMLRSGVDLAHFHFGGNFAWSNRFPARCPIPALARGGVPVVTTIHMAVGLLHGYCGPLKPLWFKLGFLPVAWLGKMRVLRHIRREITVSRQDLDRLRCWYWPLRGRFQHIYHSRLKTPDATNDAPAREPLILGVGHLALRKGPAVLAEAFAKIAARHPTWKLLLAGHAAEESCCQQIERAAQRVAAGQIQMLGQRDDTEQLMQRAAIYVQPSFHEGLPLALQEALYHGCACVATRIAGNTELVQDEENGLLVPPGDADALAGALERLIGDAALREQLSARGRAGVLAQGMTLPQMVEKHRALYAALLG